jgi:hypothetical protein
MVSVIRNRVIVFDQQGWPMIAIGRGGQRQPFGEPADSISEHYATLIGKSSGESARRLSSCSTRSASIFDAICSAFCNARFAI